MSHSGKFKVLVVDPSSSNRQLLVDCLSQLSDVKVLATASGAQALELFVSTQPALIVMDMNPGDIDGISLARRIRNRERLGAEESFGHWTPIVFLSNVMDEELLAQGIIVGGDDFLHKPVSEVILLAKVRALLRIVGMQRDIQAAHRKLKEISTLDGLTCIPNRRHFDETFATEWKRCQRAGAPLSLILGDIDYFKQFNDIYGHQAGDSCLKAVAGSLNESLFRVEDSVARYGGEEFVTLLPGTDTDGAIAVAERMRLATRELCIPHEKGIEGLISCSFGVASIHPTTDAPPQKLLHTADQGLYSAKRSGRNRVVLATPAP